MALITTLQRFRYQAFNRIGERDKELAQLRDGQLTSKRKPKSTPETRTEAFNKYLKFFYDRPRIQVNVTLNICGYLFKIKLNMLNVQKAESFQMPHHDLYPEDTLEQLVKGPPAPRTYSCDYLSSLLWKSGMNHEKEQSSVQNPVVIS